MLSVIVAAALLAWPKPLTVAVGGVSAEAREITYGCWHEPASGYFLYKSMECDGAHTLVVLTRDRRMVSASGFEVARFGRRKENSADAPRAVIQQRSFPLETKHGITIGMSREALVNKLGRPARTATRGSNRECWCALYKSVAMQGPENGAVLRNTYVFKGGKLIEIAIHRDSIPGCGNDNTASDEGWPWSQF